MRLRISRVLLEQLRRFVAADPTREVCGLLLGHKDVVDAVAEAANIAADPRISFEIDPRVHIDAIKAARAGGPAIIGVYHSHPSGDARPSQRDLDMAQPGALWLIFAADTEAAWLRGHNEFEPVRLELR